MNKKIAIIQTSPQRSASTLLMNAILGFILPNQFAYCMDVHLVKRRNFHVQSLQWKIHL